MRHRDDDAEVPAPETATTGAKPVVGATEEVRVEGTSGSTSVVARSDTGATRTSIDTSLAAEVGAGPITDAVRVRSASHGSGRARPVVDLVIDVDGDPHVVAASIADRGHMAYPLLLGRDVLEHYHVDTRRHTGQADDAGVE